MDALTHATGADKLVDQLENLQDLHTEDPDLASVEVAKIYNSIVDEEAAREQQQQQQHRQLVFLPHGYIWQNQQLQYQPHRSHQQQAVLLPPGFFIQHRPDGQPVLITPQAQQPQPQPQAQHPQQQQQPPPNKGV
jgi:hypothetical protein